MDNIKSNLKGIVGSTGAGIPINELENEYFKMVHSNLNFRSLGFNSLRQLLDNIPDVVNIVEIGGTSIVKATINFGDSETLTDLMSLVKKTKSKKPRPINRNFNKSAYYPPSAPLETVVISVSNNHYRKALLETPKGFVKQPDVNFASKKIVSKVVKENGYKTASNAVRTSVVPTSAHRNDKVQSNPIDSSRISKQDEHSSLIGNLDLFESSCWFVKPKIVFEILNSNVRILGIQSGHAVVVSSASKQSRCLLQVNNVSTPFPGDMYLWQPPFHDEHRLKGNVDISTAFPVTIIKRVTIKTVQVRIMGLLSLIDVSICDLFDMSLPANDLYQIVTNIKARSMTILPLAFIPTTTNIWDKDVYSGVYTILVSVDEGGSVLERSTKKGQFLNLCLLSYMENKIINSDNVHEKRAFLQQITYCVDRSMATLMPTYERLISGQEDLHPDNHPLIVAYNMNECANKILLGCKRLLSVDREVSNMHLLSREPMVLHRMINIDDTMTFGCFDDRVITEIITANKLPLFGIYIINDSFITSTSNHNQSLRFRTALLVAMPSIGDLGFRLGLHDM